MERIGVGPRFIAGLIDGLINMAITLLIGSWGYLGRVLASLISLGYFYTEVLQAASPGKKIMGLVIRKEDGSVADELTLQKRFAMKFGVLLVLQALGAFTTLTLFHYLGMIVGIAVLIGFLIIFKDESNQTFQDRYNKTAVFKAEEGSSTPLQ